ncbi:MAG TPA: hypothetical protein VGG40_11265 [Solirubrobacterales bacterium]|jgi:hypothetical protein
MRKLSTTLGIGAVLALAAIAALLPAAASASSTRTCPNKTMKLTIEGTPPETVSEPVKAISTEGGVTCAQAYEVIRGSLTGKPVSGWKVEVGKFKAPEGLVPELARKGSKRIKFAVQGG